jgi:hypothetical protein
MKNELRSIAQFMILVHTCVIWLFLNPISALAQDNNLVPSDSNITTSTGDGKIDALVKHITDSALYKLRKSYDKAIEEERLSLANPALDWQTSKNLRNAKKAGEHERVISILEPILASRPYKLCNLWAYDHVAFAYRSLGNAEKSDFFFRKGADAIERAIESRINMPEIVFLFDLYADYYFFIKDYKDSDYEQEINFMSSHINDAAFKNVKDMIIYNIIRAKFKHKDYDSVTKDCDNLSNWYKRLPVQENSRLFHETWKARALFKLGRPQDAINLMEQIVANTNYILLPESIKFELKEMKAGRSIY